uniref:Uncharacterized protein n=1 Tax=viral metagenome TaxID=1070528 RepID=A0A6C0BQM2_9ZZZZ
MPTFYYIFSFCWGNNDEVRSIDVDSTSWPVVRYYLETRHHMHKQRRASSYFVASSCPPGTREKPADLLAEDAVLNPNHLLVLRRFPTPSYLHDYIPPAVMDATKSRRKRPRHHPSVYHRQIPDWYECPNCGSKEHTHLECPTPEVEYVPMKHRAIPHGIPKSELRRATPKEAASFAMRDTSGNFFRV